jgi:hypothetical protein
MEMCKEEVSTTTKGGVTSIVVDSKDVEKMNVRTSYD